MVSMISSRVPPRLSAPRACSATSFGQSEATAAAITINSRVLRSRCGRSQIVPKQYSWMARAWVGQIALSSSQVFKPSLPKASSRIFLPRAARSSLICVSFVADRVGELNAVGRLVHLNVGGFRDRRPFVELGLDEG